MGKIEKITKEELQEKLFEIRPDNEHSKKGYTLVNVLPEESFNREHIADSINIPKGKEDIYGERFDKDKEIIVYCSSPQCKASGSVAQTLKDQGFTNVKHYPGGMQEWKESGQQAESASSFQ